MDIERLRRVLERHFSKDERKGAATSGAALPDGSFPIYNAEDLRNAVRLAHFARDPEAARAHIRARAAALGLPIPKSVGGSS